MPVAEEPAGLVVAMAEPLDQNAVEELRFVLNRHVRVVTVARRAIDFAIQRYYGDQP